MMSSMDDNISQLSSHATKLANHLDLAACFQIQDSAQDQPTTTIGGSGHIGPYPLSPYGEFLFRDVINTPPYTNNDPAHMLRPGYDHNNHSLTNQTCSVCNSPIIISNLFADQLLNATMANSSGIETILSGNIYTGGNSMDRTFTQENAEARPIGLSAPRAAPKKLSVEDMFWQISQNQQAMLDNLKSYQQATETRLASLETQAGSTVRCLVKLSAGIDKALLDTTAINVKSDENKKNIVSLETTLNSAMARIEKLEQNVLDLDRHNREYNLKILHVPEEPSENCKLKVAKLIKDNALLPNSDSLSIYSIAGQIEDAFRVGKIYFGRKRHIIVKLHETPFRNTIMAGVKKMPGGKTKEGYVFMDDLNPTDRETKAKYSDITKAHYAYDRTSVLFKRGRFRVKGQWLSEEEYARSTPSHLPNMQIDSTNVTAIRL